MLKGHLDQTSHHKVAGWAFDETSPSRPVRLVITVNGAVAGRILANQCRADLKAAGLGDGRCAFEFLFPAELPAFETVDVGVVNEHDGAHLPASPVTLPPLQEFDASSRDALKRFLAAESSAEVVTAKIDFLAGELDALLQRRADFDSDRHARERYRHLQRRFGTTSPDVDGPLAALAAPQPRALIIDDHLPRLDRDAGSNAIVSHTRSLQRLGFAVTFVAAQDFRSPYRSSSVLTGLDVGMCLPPYYASVEEVLRRQEFQFDLIYLHRVTNAAKYGALAREYHPRARIVFSVADLHHLRIARQAEAEQRHELQPLARRLFLAEMNAAATSDAVITHSTFEAEVLRKALPHANVVIVPWMVTARPVETPFEQRQGMAFVGGFGHDPNRDAARWLINEILPLIRKTAPIECFLVGSDLPDDILQLCGDGVTAFGQVPDLHEVFERVRITIAPLAYGAGVKGKVLESLAAGVPCVCTPVAAEGIPLPEVLRGSVTEGAAGLAELAIRLHSDGAANQAMARAGIELVSTLCSPDSVDASMRQVLELSPLRT